MLLVPSPQQGKGFLSLPVSGSPPPLGAGSPPHPQWDTFGEALRMVFPEPTRRNPLGVCLVEGENVPYP